MNAIDFLYELANNPSQALAFRRDPLGVARAKGLSEETAKILASKNSAQLRHFLAQDTGRGIIYTSETSFVYTSEASIIYTSEAASYIYTSEAA